MLLVGRQEEMVDGCSSCTVLVQPGHSFEKVILCSGQGEALCTAAATGKVLHAVSSSLLGRLGVHFRELVQLIHDLREVVGQRLPSRPWGPLCFLELGLWNRSFGLTCRPEVCQQGELGNAALAVRQDKRALVVCNNNTPGESKNLVS